MDLTLLKEVIQMVEQSGIYSLEIQEGDLKIKVSKNAAGTTFTENETSPEENMPEQRSKIHSYEPHPHELQSPMLGVFYEASSPESEPFIKVGDKVQKGDILCIIEAMKLMNEIAAEREGEIVEVLVKNGQIVEFGQALYKIK